MVKTVSVDGPPWIDAVDTWDSEPGSAVREIQSSGRTNRAKTLPLSPDPFSPEGDMIGFSATAPLSTDMAADPEATIMAGGESARFRTALELPWTACEYCCKALAGAGRTLAMAA